MGVDEGRPGYNALIKTMVLFTALKSFNNRHFCDFFLDDKDRGVPMRITGDYMANLKLFLYQLLCSQ